MSTTAKLSPPYFDASKGFLPSNDPLRNLPPKFQAWQDAADNLPKLLVTDHTRRALEDLPPFPLDNLQTEQEWRRAMVVLSFLGHGYVWCGPKAATVLPACIAVPWHTVASHVGRPPVLSYASYAIDNWRRMDPLVEPSLGNISLLQNFLGGEDEEWFILIHIEIERKIAPSVPRFAAMQNAANMGDAESLTLDLTFLAEGMTQVVETMRRMPERCDPYIYYNRVRPFIHGWKNHPELPDGLVYEGVPEYLGRPQAFRGETGAQSSIVPCLDAVLGIEHGEDFLKSYLLEMRNYMPPEHRRFLNELESRKPVRDFVLTERNDELSQAYDECVALVEEFRGIHLEYAARYIHKQAQTDSKNPHEVGTGGTPFMKYLKKHHLETSNHRLTTS